MMATYASPSQGETNSLRAQETGCMIADTVTKSALIILELPDRDLSVTNKLIS